MEAKASENIKEVMHHIESIFKIIDQYETSRPGSLGFTKLEEAILWLQVMVQQVPLKEKPEENKTDGIVIS
jgi:hypothetical protein